MMVVPLVMTGFLISINTKTSIYFGSMFAFSIMTLLLGLSKSAWGGAFVSFTCSCLFAFFHLRRKKKHILAMIVFCVFAMLTISVLMSRAIEPVQGEMGSFKNLLRRDKVKLVDPYLDATEKNIFLRDVYYFLGHNRTIPWRTSIELFRHAPLKGYGLNHPVVKGGAGLHNSYLQVLMAAGGAGFLCFYWGVILLLKHASGKIRSSNDWQKKMFFAAIVFSIISWNIQGFFQTVLNDYIIWVIAALVFIDPENIRTEINNGEI